MNITKTLFGFAAVLIFSTNVNNASAQSTNDQALIGRAHGAAHECLTGARQSGCDNIESKRR